MFTYRRPFVLILLLSFALLLIVAGGLLLGNLQEQVSDPNQRVLYSTTTLVSAVIIALLLLRATRQQLRPEQLRAQLEEESRRETQERATGIYHLATSLGSSLEYGRVLESALDVGVFGLRDMKHKDRLVGLVMLFRSNVLRIVASRGLPTADQRKVVSGNNGIIGLALKNAEPTTGSDAHLDPDLQYFVAMQDARSVLCIPLRAGFENYGVLLFATIIPDAFSATDVELLSAIGAQATVALQNAVLYDNLRQEKERLIEAEEEARKKLARDLHDGPTQNISAIAMRIGVVKRNIEQRKGDTLLEDLGKIEEIAGRTTREIRDMLFTLRPLVLESQGLPAALQQFAYKMKETHNVHVGLELQTGADEALDPAQQGVLFYIIEEAVGNARKHAQASRIDVRLYRVDRYITTEIQDDGVGFDVGEVGVNYDERGSLGMLNMRERASMIDGTLEVQSAVGKGTRINIVVPLRQPVRGSSGQIGANNGSNGANNNINGRITSPLPPHRG